MYQNCSPKTDSKTGVWHLIYCRILKKVVLHVCGLQMSATLQLFVVELFDEFYSY